MDDRIETSLLNLIRGTSQKGLGNMKFVDEAKNMTTVRPLLNMKKADILALCRKNEISYFTDASNFDDNYTARNKLRNTLIPQITSLLPQGAVKRYDSWRLIYEQ